MISLKYKDVFENIEIPNIFSTTLLSIVLCVFIFSLQSFKKHEFVIRWHAKSIYDLMIDVSAWTSPFKQRTACTHTFSLLDEIIWSSPRTIRFNHKTFSVRLVIIRLVFRSWIHYVDPNHMFIIVRKWRDYQHFQF